MPIRFYCRKCDGKMKVPDGSGGKTAKCPRCGTLQPIPNATMSRGEKLDKPDKPVKAQKSVLEAGSYDPAEALAAFGGTSAPVVKHPGEDDEDEPKDENEDGDGVSGVQAESKIIEIEDPQLAEDTGENAAISDAQPVAEDEPRPAAELESAAEEARPAAPRPMIPSRKPPQVGPSRAKIDPPAEIEILPDQTSGDSNPPQALGEEIPPMPQPVEDESPRKPVAKAIRGSLTGKKGQSPAMAVRAKPKVSKQEEAEEGDDFVGGAAQSDDVSIDLDPPKAQDTEDMGIAKLTQVSKAPARGTTGAARAVISESKGVAALTPPSDSDTTLVAMAWLLRVLAALGLGVTAKLVMVAFDLGGTVPINALVATVGGLILSAIPLGVAEGLMAINAIRRKMR